MEYLVEKIDGDLVYLGTTTNAYLVLKKFNGNDNSNIIINSNTEIILNSVFEGKTITSLTLPSSLKKIKQDAFKDCQITTLNYNNTVDNWCCIDFENYYANPLTASVNHRIEAFGSSLIITTDVRAYAFASYILNQVTLTTTDSHILNIAKDAFLDAQINRTLVSNIDYVTNIKFESLFSNPMYYSQNLYVGNSEITTVVLYSEVVSDYAFVNLRHLTHVGFTSRVKIIGHNAFLGCPDSIYQTDPNNTIKFLEDGYVGRILMEVIDPNNFQPISGYTYVGISADLNANIEGYLDIDKTILARYTDNVNVEATTKFILNDAFKNTNIRSVNIPSDIIFIGSEAFKNCHQLMQSISLPSSIYMIGEGAFQNSAITELHVYTNDDIIRINFPAHMCDSCTQLVVIDCYSATPFKIGEKAFAYCSNLINIILNTNDYLEYIGDQAFVHCTSLGNNFNTPIIIPSTVKYIGSQAFYGCNHLKKIEIYCDTTTIIKDDSFASCFDIIEVYAPYLGNELLLGGPSLGYLGYYAAEIVTNPDDHNRGELQEHDGILIYGRLLGDTIDPTTATFVGYTGIKTSLIIPTVKRIKAYSCYNKPDLVTIKLEDSSILQSVGVAAFEKSNALQTTEYNGLYYLGDYENPYTILIGSSYYNLNTVNVKISPMTRFICQGALSEIKNINQLSTPVVNNIITQSTFNSYEYHPPIGNIFGKNAFSNVEYDIQELSYYGENGEIYTSEYYIPKTLYKIEVTQDNIVVDGTFAGCSSLTQISLSNLTNISANTFYKCTNLQDLSIQGSGLILSGGLLHGMSSLVHLRLPHIGRTENPGQANVDTVFGYVFGDTYYDGSVAINQCYGGISDVATYYIPTTLKTVIIDNGLILSGSFDGCYMLTSIQLPDHLITDLGDFTFRGCTNLQNIKNLVTNIESVSTIGNSALYHCEKLAIDNLTLNNISSIGDDAFNGCANILQININTNNLAPTATIGNTAIANCSKLVKLSIQGNNITSLPEGFLCGCSSLTNLTLPFIGGYRTMLSGNRSAVFGYIFGSSNYSGAQDVNQCYERRQNGHLSYWHYYIPSSIRDIVVITGPGGNWNTDQYLGLGIFSFCSMLTSVVIQNNINLIPYYAFTNCNHLSVIQYPENTILGIGAYAFQNTLITSFILPSTSYYMGEGVFNYCSQLTNADLSTGRQVSIPKKAFLGCHNLKTVKIPTAVTQIHEQAFKSCDNLTSISNLSTVDFTALTSIGNEAFRDCAQLYFNNLLIPSSALSVGSDAFNGCAQINAISFSGVNYLGSDTFKDCINLVSAQIETQVDATGSIGMGACTFKNCTSLKSVSFVVYTDMDFNQYANYAPFIGCVNLENLSIIGPNISQIITPKFLSGCGKLKTLTLPFVGKERAPAAASADTVFGYIFGNTAFEGASKVKQWYTITDSVEYYIPDSLTTVIIGGGTLFYGAFQNCKYIKHISLPTNSSALVSIPTSGFAECAALEEITIPNTVTSIGRTAFSNCSSLSIVTISNTVAELGLFAFTGCSNMTDFIIENGSALTQMPPNLLWGCGKLETIRIPFVGAYKTATTPSSGTLFGVIFGSSPYDNSISRTQKYASDHSVEYYFPQNLTNVTIDGGNILYGAFSACNFIDNLTLGSSITQIGEYACEQCFNLSIVTAPGVTEIKTSAFSACIRLARFNDPESSLIPSIDVRNITLGTYSFQSCTPSLILATNVPSNAFFNANPMLARIDGNISSDAFSSCMSLNTVLAEVGMHLSTGSFTNCTNLDNIVFYGTKDQWDASIDSGWDNACPVYSVYCQESNGYYRKYGNTWVWEPVNS